MKGLVGFMNLFRKVWDIVEDKYLDSKEPWIFEIIFTIVTSSITYLTVLKKFVDLFSDDINIVYKILLVFLFLTLVVLVTILIRRLRKFRYEILQRNNFIEVVVNELDPNYQIEEVQEIHEIKKNGDGFFNRTVLLQYINEKVPWYEMSIGITHKKTDRRGKKITVFGPDNRTRLANLPFKYEASKTHHAIILNPILTEENQQSRVVITREWKQVWQRLIEKNDDNGMISFKSPAKKLELTFILPKKFEFVRHSISPKIGKWKINDFDQQNRQSLTLIAENIPSGKYEYKLSIREKKS